jgi:hypothetical protein
VTRHVEHAVAQIDPARSPLSPGTKAPDFTLVTTPGEKVSLAD